MREAYFGDVDNELEEYVSGAYMIGMGIRLTNERSEDGEVSWAIQLRSDEVMLPASAETRAWAVPDGVKVLRTWTSADADHNVVREALEVADVAGAHGHWVRVHTVIQSDDEDLEGSGGSTFVVDVFDAPIPPDEDDESPEAFSAQFAQPVGCQYCRMGAELRECWSVWRDLGSCVSALSTVAS